MTLALEVHNLTRRFGSRAAVDALHLTVHEGDVYGFLGPNGAGKTTAMRCILGLLRADEGSVAVFGERDPVDRLRHVGAIIETPAFHGWMSGRDNLRQAGWYGGLSGAALERAIDRALDRVGLSERARDPAGSFSLGMKQRLAIARCLLTQPRLLVLDEPTNGLDIAGMRDMRELIRSLALHDKLTVLVSSHLLPEVQAVCNRVGVLFEGKMRAEGEVAALLRAGGDATWALRCDDPDALQATLDAMADVVVTGREADRVLAQTAVDPAQLNRRCFEAGLTLSGLESVDRDLEDVFLELTR